MSSKCRLPLLVLVAALLVPVLSAVRPACAAGVKTWLCFYGAELEPAEYQRFDLVVFDGFRHPLLASRKPGEPLLLGSVSAGRSTAPAPSWEQDHDKAFGGGAATPPPANLDIRSPEWQAQLLDTLIPQVLAQGFDGILLDSLDSALGTIGGPAQDRELRAAALAFLARLRQKHPSLSIAMNRGLELLPEAARFLDFLLVEELTAEYDFVRKEYRDVRSMARQVVVAAVRKAQAANPGLTVLSLDYAAPDQAERIREAIRYARSKGFAPYVSTPALDQQFTHTLAR